MWLTLGRFLLKHWLVIAICIAMASGAAYMRHQGYESGKASRDDEVTALETALRVADESNAAYTIALQATRAELAKRDADDKKLAKAAEEAVRAAEAAERDANKALDFALKQLQEASRKPACKAVLDMDLSQCGL